MADEFQHIHWTHGPDKDFVVIPSLTFDNNELEKLRGVHHYEERLLFTLILLRYTNTRLVYVTSLPIAQDILNYYFSLLPPDVQLKRDNLLMLSTEDSSPISLSEKILRRPRLLNRIREYIRPGAVMTVFRSTPLEARIAEYLNMTLHSVRPDLMFWGGKDGSRRAFAASGVPCPDGVPLTHRPAVLVERISRLLLRNPGTQRVVVKLNEGFSGEGNAVLHVQHITSDPLLMKPDNAHVVDSARSSLTHAEGVAQTSKHLLDSPSASTNSSCATPPTSGNASPSPGSPTPGSRARTAMGPGKMASTQGLDVEDVTKGAEENMPIPTLDPATVGMQEHRQKQGTAQLRTGTTPTGPGTAEAHDVQPEPSKPLKEAVLRALENDDPSNPERTMRFCSPLERWERFVPKIATFGAIAELFVEGATTSPSVQCVIDAAGNVEAVSTHEQVLDGQIYKGCLFPAREDYNTRLLEYGRRVAQFLADQGVVDNLGIDFMCVPLGDGTWDIQALEINLRLCGTTHPYMTLKLLTGGRLDSSTGLYVTQRGDNRFYVATDNMEDPSFRSLTAADIIDIVKSNNLQFDHETQQGVVFHLLGCLSEWGKVGLTAIAESRDRAKELFDRAHDVLIQEAQRVPTLWTEDMDMGDCPYLSRELSSSPA